MPSRSDPADVLRPTAALLGAHIAVEAAIEQRAVARTGLDATTSDLLLRIALSPEGHTRAVDLCRQLRLSQGYVSRRIDRAVADGLVERRPDPNDRRARVLTLTEAGRAAADEFMPLLVAVVDELVTAALDADDVETLIRLLGRLEASATASLDTNTNDPT